jgi:hypothetical protein
MPGERLSSRNQQRRKYFAKTAILASAFAIGGLWDYHFHATKKDDSQYSGPSGEGPLGGGDLGVLEDQVKEHQMRINCVMTKLNGRKFNADIYFKEPTRDILGGYFNRKSETVIVNQDCKGHKIRKIS